MTLPILILILVTHFQVDTNRISLTNGFYYCEAGNMGLEITKGTFKLTQSKDLVGSGCLYSTKEIASGKAQLRNDTVFLVTAGKQIMLLSISFNEGLEFLQGDYLKQGWHFELRAHYYENGQPQENGGWEDGKKDGVWLYYNEQGELINQRLYRKGKLKKDRYQFKWEK